MKARYILTLTTLSLALLFFSGCYKSGLKIEGNNIVTEETRVLPPFTKVANEGTFNVYLIPDTTWFVTIEAESNLIPHIRSVVTNNTLEIDTRDNLRNHAPMKLFIHSPDFFGAYLSGSGTISGYGLNEEVIEVGLTGSGDIDLDAVGNAVLVFISGSGNANVIADADYVEGKITGSGNMHFTGQANKGVFLISGSGSMHAYDLDLAEADATISGSGNMYLSVTEYLKVLISGTGSVFYLGNPVISSTITGSGNIIHP